MIGETGERKSAVATPDGKSRKKKKKKKWYEARKRNVWKAESLLNHVNTRSTRVQHCNAAIHKPGMHDN